MRAIDGNFWGAFGRWEFIDFFFGFGLEGFYGGDGLMGMDVLRMWMYVDVGVDFGSRYRM